eukprot:31502-Pelagococcus_subviridis.AAC.28
MRSKPQPRGWRNAPTPLFFVLCCVLLLPVRYGTYRSSSMTAVIPPFPMNALSFVAPSRAFSGSPSKTSAAPGSRPTSGRGAYRAARASPRRSRRTRRRRGRRRRGRRCRRIERASESGITPPVGAPPGGVTPRTAVHPRGARGRTFRGGGVRTAGASVATRRSRPRRAGGYPG